MLLLLRHVSKLRHLGCRRRHPSDLRWRHTSKVGRRRILVRLRSSRRTIQRIRSTGGKIFDKLLHLGQVCFWQLGKQSFNFVVKRRTWGQVTVISLLLLAIDLNRIERVECIVKVNLDNLGVPNVS